MSETTEPKRGPGRPPLRSDMRVAPSRAEADRRTKEILGHLGDLDQGTDEFYIPDGITPDGWTYEWKRRTVLNQEDPAYTVQLARMGWEPVPTERHPEMMPKGGDHPVIERKGMVLMQRPEAITERIRDMDRQRARDQVRMKEEQLSAAPPGHFDRTSDRRVRPKINKSYDAMPVPDA